MQRLAHWLIAPEKRIIKLGFLTVIAVVLFFILTQFADIMSFILNFNDPQNQAFVKWASGDESDRHALVTVQREACPNAPFILPTDGFIGLLYADPRGPYSRANPHQGIDIFSETEPGITPVYAAYDGYITRESTWRSALIQRVPDDPLHHGEQIWLYYAHMADRDGNSFIADAFPAGTQERFVEQGSLLGYTGDYNGTAARQIWVHLHFSIVRDDGNGRYRNEHDFNNTKDPSPYLGMTLNYKESPITTDCVIN